MTELKDATVQRLLSAVREERVVDLTSSLVRIPSVNPPGDYGDVVELVLRIFSDLGLEISTTNCHEGRTNVVGRLTGSAGEGGVCLASHMDVVPAGDRSAWDRDPFDPVVEDGVLWGRGSADSKGMLAGMIAAIEAIKQTTIPLTHNVYLVAYVDDETAGPCGLRDVFKHGLARADHVILGEATDHVVQYAFKGRLWFSIETVGLASHGAFPDRGINAIDKAYRIIGAVREMELGEHPVLGRDSISIGKIEGGHQVNVVADRCRVWFDIRWGPPRSADDVLRRVIAAVEAVDERFDPSADVEVTEKRDPLEFDPDAGLYRVMRGVGERVLGAPLELGGWYSSGELWPLYRQDAVGVGAVVGPGEPWQAHAFNEHIPVAELYRGAQIYALVAAQLAAG